MNHSRKVLVKQELRNAVTDLGLQNVSRNPLRIFQTISTIIKVLTKVIAIILELLDDANEPARS